ncbi:SufD family Fe-S cluster assembly protein [Alicyclobacillus sp. SO9]|uniref:SufB/SufD family protein n=1 Tax=Alicyclobacillus sp. SO9 TaxID=2665646 RepID=UPI0018E80731|nr:SufD family Fe-S cluster assembly protein [Alicyclobacillus sp. SO9]QQE80287.1 SufD family Fe-S cluster assembly protein [Alicyclobacillus sp. SO9]
MAEELTTAATSSLVQELVARHQEPEWLRQKREEAWKTFAQLPSPKLEKTDVRKRTWEVSELSAKTDGRPQEEIAAVLDAAAEQPFIYLRDGYLMQSNLPSDLKSQGVVVEDLQTAVTHHEALLREHLGTVVDDTESKWAALNAAIWENGVFVYIPKEVAVESPIQFIYEESLAGGGARPRVLIVAETGSKAEFSELSFTPQDGVRGRVHSEVMEVVADVDSHLKISAVTQFHKGPTNFVLRRAKVAKDAKVEWIAGDIGDGFTVALVESRLEGSGAMSSSRALGFGFGRQRLDLTLSMDHYGRSSESDIVMHGVMLGKANSVYRSSSHIRKGAADAASEQSDRMLVLNKSTRADAIPMLLIDDNNVRRCGHAASVGKLDEIQIYYLMSRGVSKTEATKMIVWGYLAPTVDLIPVESMRHLLSRRIDEELEA